MLRRKKRRRMRRKRRWKRISGRGKGVEERQWGQKEEEELNEVRKAGCGGKGSSEK